MDCPDHQVGEWLTSPQVDLIEWRLDSFLRKRSVTALQESLSLLSRQPRNPVIATNRPRIGGGFFEGSEEARLQVLQLAAHAGADWVDLEEWVSEENLVPFQALEVPILLSYHDFDHTPERSVLLAQLESMAGIDSPGTATVRHRSDCLLYGIRRPLESSGLPDVGEPMDLRAASGSLRRSRRSDIDDKHANPVDGPDILNPQSVSFRLHGKQTE
jgi:hypothetical protein